MTQVDEYCRRREDEWRALHPTDDRVCVGWSIMRDKPILIRPDGVMTSEVIDDPQP